jgi:predicted nucleotidyltransferase
MRKKTSPIDALMPRTRQLILAATLLQPQRAWYLSDLARHLKRTPSSLQRELAVLTSAGILTARRHGRMVFFQANTSLPIFAELQTLLAKTTGVVDVLHKILLPYARHIKCAFIFGSIAGNQERPESDIDLMLIGQLRLSDIAPPLRLATQRLAREINPKIYTPEEFLRKLAIHDHFLESVMTKPKLFVFGTQNDLEQAAA